LQNSYIRKIKGEKQNENGVLFPFPQFWTTEKGNNLSTKKNIGNANLTFSSNLIYLSSIRFPFQEYLCGVLVSLYESILIGNCPCHSFGKLPGHTGGFYQLVCRHGVYILSIVSVLSSITQKYYIHLVFIIFRQPWHQRF
jgi:hypothetical protein